MMENSHITIRIYHGSQRKWKSRKDFKEIGGMMGGHVAIQVENYVYGFFYKDLKKLHSEAEWVSTRTQDQIKQM